MRINNLFINYYIYILSNDSLDCGMDYLVRFFIQIHWTWLKMVPYSVADLRGSAPFLANRKPLTRH